MKLPLTLLMLFSFNLLSVSGLAAQTPDEDYKVQGEYSGAIEDGENTKYGIQVIALGKGKFTGVGYMGGLPGDGWNSSDPTRVEKVEIDDGILEFKTDEATAIITDGIATIKAEGEVIGKLKRVVRTSPTFGPIIPANAKLLFEGKDSLKNWNHKGKPGQITDDGLLKAGTASVDKFQNHHVHIEFLLPFKPEARGQARGNSGIYIQGRYEVQMLDSFGLTGENNECGGIYSIKKPDVNMCFPPMQWQSYDIEFYAAKFDGDKKVKNARMTVKHNGVVIHDDVELPKSTTASPNKEGPEPGFIYLQDHGNPVCYRNIWVTHLGEDNENIPSAKAMTPMEKDLNVQHPVQMKYLLHLPVEYESQEKWPLMLFLHGAGERGDDLGQVKLHGPPKLAENGKDMPFILVSPQCKKDRWWEPVSLTALLDEIEKNYKVDSDRIYVTGLSMGGFGTWSLASHSPERFAAVAPVCGGGDQFLATYLIGDRIPIWVFHGAKDKVVPISRSESLVNGFKDKGIDVKFTVYPEAGHDSWTETYDSPELYEWLLSHSRKK